MNAGKKKIRGAVKVTFYENDAGEVIDVEVNTLNGHRISAGLFHKHLSKVTMQLGRAKAKYLTEYMKKEREALASGVNNA